MEARIIFMEGRKGKEQREGKKFDVTGERSSGCFRAERSEKVEKGEASAEVPEGAAAVRHRLLSLRAPAPQG